MTAHELARLLLAGPDLPVHQSYNYGDRSRTTVTPAVDSVMQADVRYSGYHNMYRLVEEDDNPQDDDCRVIVLS